MVLFGNELGSPTIAISLDVSQNELPILLDEIQDVIRGMRPWYDVLSRFPAGYSFGLIVLCAFWFHRYILEIIEAFEDESRERIFRLILSFSPMLMWFLFYKLLVLVLPSAVFAIGQGKERFNRLKWFHRFIVTIIISLIFFVMKLVIN